MFRSIGLPELLVLLLVACLLITPTVFYVRTLKRTLELCAPDSRTMSPGKLWLLLIPLFNIAWHFLVVSNMAKSLHNEFARRNFPIDKQGPGKAVGIAMSILTAVSVIPVFVGQVAGIIAFICWIVYWAKIAKCARLLAPVAVE
jgi:hypothetical protein